MRYIVYVTVLYVLVAGALPSGASAAGIENILHISIDGLRGPVIPALGRTELPSFYKMSDEGAFTYNARTILGSTSTLPNHASMLTGRPITGTDGHSVDANGVLSTLTTIHVKHGSYVESVFDVVHDNGLSTAFYSGWTGFDALRDSYDASSGRADTIGADNGTNKVDFYGNYGNDISGIVDDYKVDMASSPYNYTLMHLHTPDSAGHADGWFSTEYDDAVKGIDVELGRLMDFIENDPTLQNNTAIILSTDHGGSGTGHGTTTNEATYTIPFYYWESGRQIGADLYDLNLTTRTDPETGRPLYDDSNPQPIRNGDGGNLALDLLGFGPLDSSVMNGQQDLLVPEPGTALLFCLCSLGLVSMARRRKR